MRRKIFFAFLVLLIILYAADSVGITLSKNPLENMENIRGEFTGRICRIQTKNAKIYLEIKLKAFDKAPIKGRVLLRCYDEKFPYDSLWGKEIAFRTMLEKPVGQRNPHCFDYRKYLMGRNIWMVGAVRSLSVVNEGEGSDSLIGKYQRFIYGKRTEFQEKLDKSYGGIVAGMLFGDTSLMEEEDYEAFRKNGTAHVLAVSGLHIGVIYAAYESLSKKRKHPLMDVLFFFCLFTYGSLAFWSPSVIRAVAMIVMRYLSKALDLRYDMLTSMSLVGIALIIYNPYVIFGAGFQMSFLALASIGFFEPTLRNYMPGWLSTVLAANLGLLIYQMYTFNFLSWVSLVANVPTVYLAGILLPMSLALFLVFASTGSMEPWELPVKMTASLMERINQGAYLKGYGAIDVISPHIWSAIFITATLFFLFSEQFTIMRLRKEKGQIKAVTAVIAMISLFFGVTCSTPFDRAELVFVDVGQGDCLHYSVGKVNVLIDGGGASNFSVGEKILKQYLLKNRVRTLDLVIATHLHTDHYKGLYELSQSYKVKKLAVFAGYKPLKGELEELFKCDEILWLRKGDKVPLSKGDYIEVLAPEGEGDAFDREDENKNSLVLKLVCRGVSTMMTGDIDQVGEGKIISANPPQKVYADILKVSHHGSRFSTADVFLDALKPKIAVIQVGKNNYGHPTAEVLDKLSKRNIKVYRNDYMGAVGIDMEDGKIKHVYTCIE